jgi:hypothetical protein
MPLPLRVIQAAGCIILVALAGATGLGTGCSAQGEGERCSYFASHDADINGNSECQSGLYCTPAFNIETTGDYDRCCPQNLQDPNNVPACYSPGNVGGGVDASFEGSPGDGQLPESSPTDGKTTDARKGDASVDSKGSDAAAEATAEGSSG